MNPAQPLLDELDARLERGEIDNATWYREVASGITPAYLAADNPRSQSVHSGDDERWEQARRVIVEAIDRDGSAVYRAFWIDAPVTA